MTIIQNWLSILVLIGCVAITRATDGEEATTHPGESMPWLKEDSEKPANFASYIVGGQAAELQLQWVASLQNRIDGEYQHWCGGSLIAKGWILTAAHCIDKFNTVCIGGLKLANNAEFHCVTVKKIYQHEQYDSLSLANDIMLVEFDSDYSGAPVKLTSGDLNEDTDDSAKIVGWGKTESLDVSYELKELSVKVYPNDDCSVWGGGIPEELPQSVMCTETLSDGEGFCTGDSGGPLFAEVEGETLLIGVISFGSTTCVGLPMVYTRVGEYLTWIQETMENSNPDLDDISLPASCADGSCIEVKDSAFGRTETIYNFSLSKGVELQQAFFFQGDLQSDVSFYIEGIEQRLGAINGNPSAFMPLSAGSCFIPGDYRVVIDLGIWRTNKYDQYRLLVPKDLNSLPECNPFPELDPLQTLSAPDICLETPGRCIELEGEFVREWTLFSYQQSDYRRLSIWFQGPTSYDMNLLKGMPSITTDTSSP
ncbi:hypothetical protein, variant [Sphaeroforma arctica JP610]|uniref:Peptidase S1 domain-containing protein n=1 Tax=Sphaeroforma arctica JP610 TaxID=667725 RepID=A0A0L0FGI0_9EUKA|nr:hypothetical protein, variant [Sphaeroforma arctica JP610]KNC75887.1 hypothetical protein, variant [Sphaeroforma arctica JP610]|eukprot:XP_014149789.1 hypothetical protein, variant [Sphaeroforma arctica JP610]